MQAQFVKRQERGGKQGEVEHGLMDASKEQKAEFAAWLDTVRFAVEDAGEEEPSRWMWSSRRLSSRRSNRRLSSRRMSRGGRRN